MVIEDIKAKLMERNPKDVPSKAACERLIKGVFDIIEEALKEEETVRISGFGTFETKVRAARKGLNLQTGDRLDIPETKVVRFRPATALRDSVR